MKRFTYSQIFEKDSLIKNLPIMFDGRGLPKGLSAKVVLVRVQYEKYLEAFEKEMQSVLKELKKEGFDDRLKYLEKLEEVDKRLLAVNSWTEGSVDESGNLLNKPLMPSDDDLTFAEKIRPKKEEIEKEILALQEEYRQARISKSYEEVSLEERLFTLEDLAEIILMIGTDNGTMPINKTEIPKSAFINLIASNFCE